MQIQGDVFSGNKKFAVIFVLTFNIYSALFSQLNTINPLSVVQHHDLPFRIHDPMLMNYSSTKYPDLLYFHADSSAFAILRNNGKGMFQGNTFIGHSSNVTSVTVGNINNDGIDDIVIVHRDQNQLEILVSNKTDSTFLSSIHPVNYYPEQAVIGDITNDKIADVISFGKLSSGISVLQGKGNGSFSASKILFSDIPVSDFSLIALNGDNITDVALHNWLTNETTLFLGLGKSKYSEQTVLSFAQDTVQTLFADFNSDGIADIGVLSIQNKTLQIMEGDGLGNFSFLQVISLSDLSYRLKSGSFRDSFSRDIVVFDRSQSTFSLLLNRSDGTFYDEIVFGIQNPETKILSGDINGDKFADVLLIDEQKIEYAIILNSQSKMLDSSNTVSLAVGSKPSNIYVNDINNDGNDDIVVSNGESSTLSILISKGKYFSGQLSIDIPERPTSLSLYSKSDTSITFYTSHPDQPKISLVSLRKEADSNNSLTGDLEQYSISLPEKPVNVLPDVSFMQKGVSLYVFMSSATNTIVFYQQVKGTRFIAKSLVPLIPSKIIYSTINDLNDDGKTDLLYVYSEDANRKNVLGITLNDSTNEFKGKVFSFPLPDTTIRRSIILIDDFNGDQRKDCLLYMAPANDLRIALGNSEMMFGKFEQVISNISISSPSQIQLYDFDNDGILDILILDKELSDLSVYRGKGNGTFKERRFLSKIPNGSIYRCGDLNGDNITDIVFTNPLSHTVTVVYGNH